MEKVFATLLGNPQKMVKYDASPIRKAVLLALYDYVKDGHKLEDLPWFAPAKRHLSDTWRIAA